MAPQNTFLENIVRRSSGKKSCSSKHPTAVLPTRAPPILPIPSLSQRGWGMQTTLPGGFSYQPDLFWGGGRNEVVVES